MMYTNSTLNGVPNASKTSLFYCPKEPDFAWNLDNTTLPWILSTIILLGSPITILLNASVVIVVWKRKDLRRKSNIVISSMAVADLLVGAVSMPISSVVDLLIIHQVFLERVCTLNTANLAMMDCLLFSSIFHLVVIAWERYIAIRKWIDYRVIVTTHRLKKLTVLAWMGALFFAVPLALMQALEVDLEVQNILLVIAFALVAFSFTAIVYLNIMVLLGIRQRRTSEISEINVLVQAKLESKVAKTTALLTAAVICTLVSGGVLLLLGDIFPVFRENAAFRIAEALLLLNSMINPIIYVYRDRRFRNAVLEFLRLRKPAETHRVVGAVRIHGGKDRLVSMGNVQSPLQDVGKHLARSSTFDRSVVIDSFDIASVKRSRSTPSLRIVHDLHLNQTPSVVTRCSNP